MLRIKYLRYPQYNWVESLKPLIDEYQLTRYRLWVDLPAGDGIISYWLHNAYSEQQILAIDLDAEKLSAIQKTEGIQTEPADIFQFRFKKDQKVWFFINSLYLLPDPDRIFIQQEYLPEYLVVVTPNIHSSNYLYFHKRFPDFNMSAMDEQGTHNFFARFGYELKQTEAVTQMTYFKWFRFPGLKYLFNLLFIWLEPKHGLKKGGAYFLALYQRKQA